MSKKTPDSTPTTSSPEVTTESAGPVKTADAIRAALRNKASGGAARGGTDRYGADQKPPTPPSGTRRSMGKR